MATLAAADDVVAFLNGQHNLIKDMFEEVLSASDAKAREKAFTDLRRRSSSEPVAQFVSTLLQSQELGAPLAESLNQIAADLARHFTEARTVGRDEPLNRLLARPALRVQAATESALSLSPTPH